MNQRQIVLDTETTGLEHREGHRIIEIGCVEMINRKLTGNNYHIYLNPEREIDLGAIEVHGITNEFVADKPLFKDIADEFMHYVTGSELVIHNAPFDVGFLNAELTRMANSTAQIEEVCGVHDTLTEARKMFPGQRNDLDSLCKRYEINNSHRELHGALLDAEILADVYLAMTGGQTDIVLDIKEQMVSGDKKQANQVDFSQLELLVDTPTSEEAQNHVEWVNRLDEAVAGKSVWTRLNDKTH